MRTIAFLTFLQSICVVVGCSHYHGRLSLDPAVRRAAVRDLGVAGILDRRSAATTPTRAERASERLVQSVGKDAFSAKLDARALSLLLASPAELSIRAAELEKLRQETGRRYLIVGEQGAQPVFHTLVWDSIVIVPTPFVVLTFNFPMAVSEEADILHATRILRVIDLEKARVLGESYEILLDDPGDNEFTSSEISRGLNRIKLSET